MTPSRRVRDERRWALRNTMERRRQRRIRTRLALIIFGVTALTCVALLVLLYR